jgi:hypothetical protein
MGHEPRVDAIIWGSQQARSATFEIKRTHLAGFSPHERAFLSPWWYGILLALPVNAISTGTTNFETFSEVAFNFRVDSQVALTGMTIALIAGIMGGALPALSAARMPITRALREI